MTTPEPPTMVVVWDTTGEGWPASDVLYLGPTNDEAPPFEAMDCWEAQVTMPEDRQVLRVSCDRLPARTSLSINLARVPTIGTEPTPNG